MPILIDETNHEIYSWEDQTAIVGRTPDSTVQIKRSGVSRQHCRISLRGVNYTLTDLGSHNGTRINGDSLEKDDERLIEPGDTLYLGTRGYRFELEKPEDWDEQVKEAEARKAMDTREPTKLDKPEKEKTKKKTDLKDASLSDLTIIDDDGEGGNASDYWKKEAEVAMTDEPLPVPEPLSEDDADGSALQFIDDDEPTVPDSLELESSPGGSENVGQKISSPRDGETLCPKCLAANLPDSSQCWSCQAPLPKEKTAETVAESQRAYGGKCPQCGNPYPAGTANCGTCGMNLGDRRAVIAGGYTATRRHITMVTTAVGAVLAVVAWFTYRDIQKKEQASTVDQAKLFESRLEQATETFKGADEEMNFQRYELALDLYKEAEEAAAELLKEEDIGSYPEVERQAKADLRRFQKKRETYAAWLEEHRKEFQIAEALEREAEQQRELGRVRFHGGWISPGEFGIRQAGKKGVLAEEASIEATLAQKTSDEAINPLLEAFLGRAWAFQGKYYLKEHFWEQHKGPLLEPEFLIIGARGTRYPEGVTAAHFSGNYLARIPFVKQEKLPLGKLLQWDETKNGIRVEAVFHDSRASAEAVSRSKNVVTLSQNTSLVSSVVTGVVSLSRSKEDFVFLENLAKGEAPPVLQIVFKVSSVEDKSSSRDIVHTIDDGKRLTQTLTHHDYTLRLEPISIRWFRRISSAKGEPIHLPAFLDEEPEGGLYDIARRATGK